MTLTWSLTLGRRDGRGGAPSGVGEAWQRDRQTDEARGPEKLPGHI